MKDKDIELIKDVEMREFLESAMRGGLCTLGTSNTEFDSQIGQHSDLFLEQIQLMFKERLSYDTECELEDDPFKKNWSKFEKVLKGLQMEECQTKLIYKDANNL